MRRKIWPLAYHGVLPRSAGTKEIADDRQSGRAIDKVRVLTAPSIIPALQRVSDDPFWTFYLWARKLFFPGNGDWFGSDIVSR